MPGAGGHLAVIPDPDGADDRGQSRTLIGGPSYEILHERWPRLIQRVFSGALSNPQCRAPRRYKLAATANAATNQTLETRPAT